MMAAGMRLIAPCRRLVARNTRIVSANKWCSRRGGGYVDVLVVNAYLSTGANVGVLRDFKRVTGHADEALNVAVAKYDTLVDMYLGIRDLYSSRPLFGTRTLNGKVIEPELWKWTTYKEFGESVDAIRALLYSKGIRAGDVVACISSNRKEWAESAYATYSLGATFVPMYEDQFPKVWRYIIKDSGAKLLFVSNHKIYTQTFHYSGVLGALENVICFDGTGIEARYALPSLLKGVRSDVSPIIPHPDHVANIVYTSGTTGDPKGVMVTHRNTLATIGGIQDRLPDILHSSEHSLSFLPWAHCFGQTCELHAGMGNGMSMAISQGPDKIMKELLETRPTLLLAVPALYKRIFDGIHDKVQTSSALKRYLFNRALKVAHHYRMRTKSGLKINPIMRMQHALLDRLVLSNIRSLFGGRLKAGLVGGAAIPSCIQTFFENVGIPMVVGYGLTENTIVALNEFNPKAHHVGSSGNPLSNLSLKIIMTGQEMPDGEDGEVCVAGPGVMKGYHNNIAATDEVMMNYNGTRYFRTGDLGRLLNISGRSQLHITGRIKEQFKLVNGKYIVPGPVEVAMQQSIYIYQVLLYGDNKPFCVCLIVPDVEKVRKWAVKKGYASKDTTLEELMNNKYVNNLIGFEIDTTLDGFKRYEKPRKFTLLGEPFTKERGTLSQKMSVKRHAVLNEYGEVLQSMYVDSMRHDRRYDSDDDDNNVELVMSG